MIANFLFFLAHSTLHKMWATKRQLSDAKTFSALEEIALGSLAGSIAKGLTTPLSQITVRQQSESSSAQKISAKVKGKMPQKAVEADSDSDDEPPAENSVTQIVHDIYEERGWLG